MRTQPGRIDHRSSIKRRCQTLILSPLFLLFIGCEHNAARELPLDISLAPGAAAPPSRLAVAERASIPEADKTDNTPAPPTPRKIVYNAQISLVVENIAALGSKLNALASEAGGYISQTDQSSDSQTQRRSSWTARIPVERFDTFLSALTRLGELQHNHVDSQDVTAEFYDIEARILNKQQEEKRLLKHLADSTGKLEDILAVERELTRVRGEIEQMQGRIRYLANVSALSTVTISAVEIKDYTPPLAPTFATQIARTFNNSLQNLTEFGKSLALLAVAIAPWLPLLLLLMAIAYLLIRKFTSFFDTPVVLTRPTR